MSLSDDPNDLQVSPEEDRALETMRRAAAKPEQKSAHLILTMILPLIALVLFLVSPALRALAIFLAVVGGILWAIVRYTMWRYRTRGAWYNPDDD
jgi:Flp pilus assembly protein TadB